MWGTKDERSVRGGDEVDTRDNISCEHALAVRVADGEGRVMRRSSRPPEGHTSNQAAPTPSVNNMKLLICPVPTKDGLEGRRTMFREMRDTLPPSLTTRTT
jgi:hypothetical protein